jgi:hypothetical protein
MSNSGCLKVQHAISFQRLKDDYSNVSTATQRSTDLNKPPFVSLLPLIIIKCIFTLVGGFMDAYAFISHGHVFANAQTGNVVLFCRICNRRQLALAFTPPAANLDPQIGANGSTTLLLSSRPERSVVEGPAVQRNFRGNVFPTKL